MFNNDDETQIKKYYSLLCGMQEAINWDFVDIEVVDKFNNILKNIQRITNDTILLNYEIKDTKVRVYNNFNEATCHITDFDACMKPILRYLKDNYINEDVTKIGTLYSTIENDELKKRCLDILSSKDAFDRVINQATQVLETEIKKKAKLEKEKLIGINLISKAIAPKKENTILLFSDEPEIQEAYAFLFKGIIGTYRNPTHHSTDYVCTREDAFKCCAFIDYLLKELNHCKVVEKVNS